MDHGNKTQYWPLQNFVEISVVFLIPVVAYTLLLLNRWRRSPQNCSIKDPSQGHDSARCNLQHSTNVAYSGFSGFRREQHRSRDAARFSGGV